MEHQEDSPERPVSRQRQCLGDHTSQTGEAPVYLGLKLRGREVSLGNLQRACREQVLKVRQRSLALIL